MQERYIKWWTPYLSRAFEMLVFGNGGGLPLIIFPTSFGNYHQNKDFGLTASPFIAPTQLISTASITKAFIPPIACAPISLMKM